MTPLDHLLLFAAGTLIVALLLGRSRTAGPILAILYAGQLLVLLQMGFPETWVVASSFEISAFGQAMHWRFDALSWFFAVITLGAAWLAAWYGSALWLERFVQQGGSARLFHVALAANVFTMLLLLGSGDLLSLFLGWELVSWSGFLLMALAGGEAARAALRYLAYGFAGAMAILGGLALLFTSAGSLQYDRVAEVIQGLGSGQSWVLLLLLGGGFAVKMAILPFHLWQPAAYAFSPGPGAAFLGAISSRMGLYALILLLVQLFSIARIDGLWLHPELPWFDAREVLAWLAAATIIFPTFTALRQQDARLLLAWHGVGQGGYMLLGVVLGDALGSAGGIMHVFNHATYQASLMMVVFAVLYRTGTAELNRLGGLVTRMPLSFLVMLIGIIGLAGLPPMNGFVSKWLIYTALLTDGRPLLFVATVIGTLGTILSVYKLIHNTFLGQLRVEHEGVREAPLSMLLPMLLLSLVVFVTGMFPGLVLEGVAAVQRAVGLPVLVSHLGGVENPRGSLDMIWLSIVLFGGFGVGALLFYGANRSQRVHQLDNYAGGHFLSADVRYQYSDNFYAGLMHLIGGWYRGSFQWLEGALLSGIDLLTRAAAALFRRSEPLVYLAAGAFLVIWWAAP